MIGITLKHVEVNGKSVNVHREEKVFCKDQLDHSRNHTYLNLYRKREDTKWFTCIEVDNNVFQQGKILLYEHAGVTMIYETDDVLTCIK